MRSFLILFVAMQLGAAAPEVQVFKTATCGCCRKWVDHLKANGFAVTVKDVPSTAEYRKKYAVPDALQSCHTAVVDGYSLEGMCRPPIFSGCSNRGQRPRASQFRA